nr:ASCH domain-containing protein [Microbacterium sp. MAH-37]
MCCGVVGRGTKVARTLFLSVKPRYARSILEGRKTAEVRRRFPDVPVGTVVVLYSSSPERAILGTVRVKQAVRVDPSQVWERFSDVIDIDEEALTEYLAGAEASTVLEVEEPETWVRPVSLRSLRDLLGMEPPQSFRYLVPDQVALIRGGGDFN